MEFGALIPCDFIKNNSMRLCIRITLLLATTHICSGCTYVPRMYSAEALDGWVIDSKTKQPVKGVVVVEIWELRGGLHTDHTANIHIAETVTDANGYYSFPDWGPKFTMSGWMNRSSPFLKFYKFGYVPVGKRNRVGGRPILDYSVSEHSGKKIKLEKFDGAAEQYPKKLGSVYSFLRLGYSRGPFACMWKQVPIFTSEMIKAEKHFRQRNIYSALPSFSSLSAPDCRKPEEYLKGYL